MYKNGAKQYQQVNITSEVLDADPHRLIQMLMEGALLRMVQAKAAIERNDMATKASLLGRVTEIIQTLRGSLNHDVGGEISTNLDSLYDYMVHRLLEATMQNDTSMIDEVMRLLVEVKSGWDGIREEFLKSTGAVHSAAGPTGAYVSA